MGPSFSWGASKRSKSSSMNSARRFRLPEPQAYLEAAQGLGFRVSGLGFGVSGLGFRV